MISFIRSSENFNYFELRNTIDNREKLFKVPTRNNL